MNEPKPLTDREKARMEDLASRAAAQAKEQQESV